MPEQRNHYVTASRISHHGVPVVECVRTPNLWSASPACIQAFSPPRSHFVELAPEDVRRRRGRRVGQREQRPAVGLRLGAQLSRS